MLTYTDCLNIVKKEIPGKFVTYTQRLNNGKYSFLYFDQKVGFGKDEMPCCPNEIIIDPQTGKTEPAYPRMDKGCELFDMEESDLRYTELKSEVYGYTPIEDSIKKIGAFV